MARKRLFEDPIRPLRMLALRNGTPLWMHLDLTARCNLRCVHCYVQRRPAASELSTTLWKGVLDQLAEMGALFLTFSGGEVFLRKDLFELLGHAARARFSVGVFTNGIMLDDRLVEKLSMFPVRELAVSVYSMDPRVHDSMTGRPGSHAKSRHAVELLAAAGFHVAVKTLVTKLNPRSYPEVEEWARSLGRNVTCRYDLLVTPRIDGRPRDEDLNLDLRQRSGFLKRRAGDAGAVERAVGLEKAASAWGPSEHPCYAARTGAYIGPSGDVHPCVDWRLECGNVRRTPFRRIWMESAQMKSARGLRMADMDGCAGCRILASCHPCPGLNLLDRGDSLKPSPLVCARARAVHSLKGRVGK